MFRLYGDPISGNCYKVALILHLTGRPFELVTTSVLDGETRSDAFRSLNPDGRVPLLRFPDGRCLGESNAILWSLARGTAYKPDDPATEDELLAWLFFEQYGHEPNIATVRFLRAYKGVAEGMAETVAASEAAGRHALGVMNAALTQRDFLVGGRFTIADIALVAYTQVAHEGGFALGEFPAVAAWVDRVLDQRGVEPLERLFAQAPSATTSLAAA